MLFKNKRFLYLFLTCLVLAGLMPLINVYAIYPRYSKQLISNTEKTAIRAGRHLSRMHTHAHTDAHTDADIFNENFIGHWDTVGAKEVLNDFNLMRINIYTQSGKLLYSSSPDDTDKTELQNSLHEIVAKGGIVTRTVEEKKRAPKGQLVEKHIVTTCVPVMQKGEFLGAFEIYHDITDIKNELDEIFLYSLLYPAPVMLVFLCLVFIILRRLDNRMTMHKKTAELLEEKQNHLLLEQEKQAALFEYVETAKRQWEMTMDCVEDMVLLTDAGLRIQRCNKAVKDFTGMDFKELMDKKWTDILEDTSREENDFSDNILEYFHAPSGRWLYLNIYALKEEEHMQGFVVTLHDVTHMKIITEELETKNNELQKAYTELKQTQGRLLQQEKMASIGQLAAGVAHEINNPVGFITSNLGSLGKYTKRLDEFIALQEEAVTACRDMELTDRLAEQRKKMKLDFILEDISDLIKDSLDGCERVKKIVRDLKGFSRVDQAERKFADIQECMETTLNIVWNELKYKTTIKKDYGEIEPILCYPQQLNQVFMNLLVNAAGAIEKEGTIFIKTWQDDAFIYTSIADTGSGISQEHLNRIFEPFFTTKKVGKGTGLGLSIVYDIITKNHGGDITVESEIGKGTTFTVKLPISAH